MKKKSVKRPVVFAVVAALLLCGGILAITLSDRGPDVERDYYEEELAQTIKTVKKLTKGDEPCLVFPMVTDIHYLKSEEVPESFDYCIANMKALSEELDFDFVASLGDVVEGNMPQAVTAEQSAHIVEGFASIGVPYYPAVGNHDDNRYGPKEVFTHEQLYQNYMNTLEKENVVFDTSSMEKTNYYKDFPELKLRCIFLNANTNGAYGYSMDTCKWFKDALKTEYGVIVFTHIPPIPAQNYGHTRYGTDQGSTTIRKLCEAADNFIIMFSGHNHYDSVYTEPFLSYTMNCQKFENENGDPALWTENAVKPQREKGTATEDCFDIVIIHPESGRIDTVRFGAGEDRTINYN